MKKFLLITLFIITGAGIVFVYYITRDGEFVTPEGQGTQTLDASSFEAFPLPDYAAKKIGPTYKSYFVEVEPGIKDPQLMRKFISNALSINKNSD